MNWEAVGAIGEILGALAVLVTLVFLVVQLRQLAEQSRQNTMAIQFSSYAAHADTLSKFQQNLATDEGISDVYFRCQQATRYGDDSITAVDWMRYSLTMRAVFVIHEDLYYQHEKGLIDHSYWNHRCQFLASLVRSNQVAGEWWEQEVESTIYVPGFTEAINNVELTIKGEYVAR